jgi:hypothetical protein
MSEHWKSGDWFVFWKSPILGRIEFTPDGERLHIPYVPVVFPSSHEEVDEAFETQLWLQRKHKNS